MVKWYLAFHICAELSLDDVYQLCTGDNVSNIADGNDLNIAPENWPNTPTVPTELAIVAIANDRPAGFKLSRHPSSVDGAFIFKLDSNAMTCQRVSNRASSVFDFKIVRYGESVAISRDSCPYEKSKSNL